MPAGYTIRPAVAADIASVVALDRATASLPHWSVADYTAALETAAVADLRGGIARCLFVADSDLSIIGFAVGSVTQVEQEALAELESIAVAESQRCAGIGRALCTAVIDWCRELGAKEIALEVRSQSAGPVALYTVLGFEAVGCRPGYYRDPKDDAILMRLRIDPEDKP